MTIYSNFVNTKKTKPKKQNENETLSYNTINKVLILLKKIFDTGIRKSLIDKKSC